tara:strand:- start:1475 stop:2071 length:597 start_codon:yes stop_codon:yes gene_type:complete
MNNRIISLFGIIGSTVCIIAYVIFSNLLPGYNHLTQAFSELSSVGTPNNLLYALFGFFVPGILITIFSLKLMQLVNHGNVKRYPFILLSFSGLLIAIGAAPMNYENFSALTSWLHIIGAMGSGLVFMIAGFTIAKQLRKDSYWATITKPLIVLVWLLIISGFFRESDFGGLAQKIGILAYYIYVSLLSIKAYRFTAPL